MRKPRRRPHAWRRGGRSKEACFQMSHPIEQCVLWMAFLLRPSSLVNCHSTCRGLSWDVGSPSSFFDDNICHQNTPATMLITGSCSGSRGAKGKDKAAAKQNHCILSSQLLLRFPSSPVRYPEPETRLTRVLRYCPALPLLTRTTAISSTKRVNPSPSVHYPLAAIAAAAARPSARARAVDPGLGVPSNRTVLSH